MDGVQIGLRDFHFAILNQDDKSAGVIYAAPVAVPGVIEAKITPNSASDTLFADDGPDTTSTTLGAIKVEINVKDLPLDVQCALLGHTMEGGKMVSKGTDTAPYVAIGFKSKKTNDKYRYIWLLKGQFAVPEQDYKTQKDKPEFQTPKISGEFVVRQYDSAWRYIADEDSADYAPSIGDNWFNAVETSADTTPPTVTVSPADAAISVAVGANVVWTFSEAIMGSSVIPGNFFVVEADGTPIAGTLSINADKTIVTFDPTANLPAATDFIAVCTTNIKDIHGNALAANSVTNFRTA